MIEASWARAASSATGASFSSPSSRSFPLVLKKVAQAQGLLCYPMGGTRDGRMGDHILLAPPFIATEDQLDSLVDILGRSIETVLAGV